MYKFWVKKKLFQNQHTRKVPPGIAGLQWLTKDSSARASMVYGLFMLVSEACTDKAGGYKIAWRKLHNSPSMSSLNGKAHCHFCIPKNIPYSLTGGESADVPKRWRRAACHILTYLILFNLGHFPSPGGSSSHGCMHTLAQHAAERTLNFAFLSLPPRSYLLVLEVVRTLSAPDAFPAARLIWIQGGNMD